MKGEFYELALFAGVGGGVLGTKYGLGWQTVCYVERERYAVQVIKARITDGYLDDAPIWSEVRSFTKHNNQCRRFIRALRKIRNQLVVTAGFPCQPFSVAGKRDGANDERNGWPDTIRIIREIRPRYVFLENVPGLLSAMDKTAEKSVRYFGTILGDLAQSGYVVRWRVLSAAEVGAPHKRDRLWIVAYANSSGMGEQYKYEEEGIDGNGENQVMADTNECRRKGSRSFTEQARKPKFEDNGKDVSDTDNPTPARFRKYSGKILSWSEKRRSCGIRQFIPNPQCPRLAFRKWQAGKRAYTATAGEGWWAVEPQLGRVADGVANRVDRLKAIGNGQVPAVAAAAFRLLMEAE